MMLQVLDPSVERTRALGIIGMEVDHLRCSRWWHLLETRHHLSEDALGHLLCSLRR